MIANYVFRIIIRPWCEPSSDTAGYGTGALGPSHHAATMQHVRAELDECGHLLRLAAYSRRALPTCEARL